MQGISGSTRNRNKRSRSSTDNISDDTQDKKPKQDEYTGTMITLDNNTNEENIDWSEWIAATATRNYLLDDGILDVIQYKSSVITKVNKDYQDKFIQNLNNRDPTNFVSAIMQQGNKFEREVYRLIIKKLGQDKIINIGGDTNPRSRQKYLNTIQAMNDGIPVIYQGILRNYQNKTYGIPDLLVRSDFLPNLITKVPIPRSQKNKKGPNLTIKNNEDGYHYVVIDIKFKTLNLKSDGIHLRNDGPIKAYKGQLCVYNQALGIIQGYEPDAAFILGWKWKYTSKNIEYRGDNCFERLGRIDYSKSDKEYVGKTQYALNWIHRVRNESDEWDLSTVPLPCEELYPNMCNRYDFPHHKLKQKFAEDIEEITMIWKCGPKQRFIAHENGIYSWKDPRCTPEMLGINGEFTSNIVSRILEANRSKDQNVFPKYITNNFADWKNPRHLEFFVDFEMTCGVFTEFDDLPYSEGETLIFMIGVGYVCPIKGVWVFRDFTVDRLDSDSEFEICAEFSNYIFDTIKQYDCFDVPTFCHWSHAEPSTWKRAINRHSPDSLRWYDFEWVDMLKIFHEEPVGINGCLNYSLKTIAKTFHKLGYIKTIWDNDNACADGADAAVGAYRVDRDTRSRGLSFKSDPLIKDIMKYNEVDCKVLQEIISYLRISHIHPLDSDLDSNQIVGNIDMDDIIDMSEDIITDIDMDDIIDIEIEEIEDSITEIIDNESVELFDDNPGSDNINTIIESDESDSSYVFEENTETEWYEYNSISDPDDSDDDSSELSDGDNINILDFIEDLDLYNKFIYSCRTCDKNYETPHDCDKCGSNLTEIDTKTIYHCDSCNIITRGYLDDTHNNICDCGKVYSKILL